MYIIKINEIEYYNKKKKHKFESPSVIVVFIVVSFSLIRRKVLVS